jgi:aspartate/methionine/tyrosine aminotransferase
MAAALGAVGFSCESPQGGFYLWVRVPERFNDAFEAAAFLATTAGLVVSPGEFYGPSASDYIRIAVVQPDERIALAASRLRAAV